MFRSVLCLALALLVMPVNSDAASPYAGQDSREIKALSGQEVSDYLAGKGMGLAKAAELNGYPGPAHVLELAVQLDLTAEQKARTEALFQKMQARAVALGKELVDEERRLDRLFAGHAISPDSLQLTMVRIGRLQGEVRQVHLDAHLEQTALLTPSQIERYQRLRGYEGVLGHGRDPRSH